jgi:hypothetical protein
VVVQHSLIEEVTAMVDKMDRDEDMSAHDGMDQGMGMEMEADEGATTDMEMDRPSMRMEVSTPSLEHGREDGMGMESTTDPAAHVGSKRKRGWLRKLLRRS